MLTVKQAAAMLSISTDYCYDLINSGALPAYRIGKGKRSPIRLDEAVVVAYRDSCRITGPAPEPTKKPRSKMPVGGFSFLRKHGFVPEFN